MNGQNPSPATAVMTMRVLFSKTGYAKYISHLDLQRAMMRLLRRASIPIWLTQGFNPHPYLNFCSPLSVGTEGERELLDVKLAEIMPFDEIRARLSSNLPTGFAVERVYEAARDYKEVASAAYRITLGCNADKLREFVSQPSIPVIKKTKTAERTLDLCQTAVFGNICTEGDTSVIAVTLPCSNELNVNPMLFTAAFGEYIHSDNPALRIVRTGFLDKQGELFE